MPRKENVHSAAWFNSIAGQPLGDGPDNVGACRSLAEQHLDLGLRDAESGLDDFREGEGIARPMGETGLFDDLVTNMVDVGEETGELDNMLLKVADAYEKSVDRRIDAFFRFLEPILLVIMAAVVGLIVVALFLPLLEIMGSIGSQG